MVVLCRPMSNSSKFWFNWIYVEWKTEWRLQRDRLVNLGDAISWVMSRKIYFKQCSLTDPPLLSTVSMTKTYLKNIQTAKMAHVGFPESKEGDSKYEGKYLVNADSSIYWVPFSCWRQKYVIFFSPTPEHSIHPEPRKDPWELEFLPDNGYKFQIVKGVYQVESYHLVDVSLFFTRCTEAKRIFCHGQRSQSIMRWDLRKLWIL